MIGFEIEISLLVTDQAGKDLPGDSALASCPASALKVVSDRRGGHSNVEFVTEPVSVVGANAQDGPAALVAQLAAVKEMRDALYAAKPGSFAAAIAKYGNADKDGAGARIIDFPHDYRPAELDGGDGLFLHYSVGVPFRSLAGFFDLVRKIAPFTAGRPAFLDRARFRAHQAADIAAVVCKDFATKGATGKASVDAMYAYMQRVYTQVAGVADYTSETKESGQVKNTAVALCRTSFHEIHPALPADVRDYLAAAHADESMIKRIADDYHDRTEIAGVHANFNEEVIREVGSLPPFSIKQYLASALTGAPAVPQSSIYGDMTLVAPSREDGVDLIVFELRTVGDHYKTWAQVRDDLGVLVAWVQQA